MTESLNPKDFNPQDDELARFADRLAAGEEPEMIEMTEQDQELRALEETVTRLYRAFKASEPGDSLSGRIRADLVSEWRRSGSRAWQSSVTRWQLAGIVVAATLALVVLAVPILVGSTTLPVAGAAGNIDLSKINPALFVGAGISLMVLAGALWLLARRRR